MVCGVKKVGEVDVCGSQCVEAREMTFNDWPWMMTE